MPSSSPMHGVIRSRRTVHPITAISIWRSTRFQERSGVDGFCIRNCSTFAKLAVFALIAGQRSVCNRIALVLLTARPSKQCRATRLVPRWNLRRLHQRRPIRSQVLARKPSIFVGVASVFCDSNGPTTSTHRAVWGPPSSQR
jgi:hypothetical protein